MEQGRAIGHAPIVENEFVRERLRHYKIFPQGPVENPDKALLVSADNLPNPDETIRWLMAFDGSLQEVPVREAYPSTRVGYIQVAAVLVHLAEMLKQEQQNLIDPAVIRQVTREALHSIVMAGSNVCRSDMSSVKDSWRADVYEIFKGYSVEGIALLDTLRSLVEYSDKKGINGGVVIARCSASDSCNERNIEVPFDGRACPSCGGSLFPTDVLRVHEEVVEEHPNLTSLGRLMATLEQVTMMAYIQFLLSRQPRVLGSVGFILDGPLAVFGPPAWLHAPIISFLNDMQRKLTVQNLRLPLVVGIEKSGQFAEHAAAIADKLSPRQLMLLPDTYIYRHILTFRPAAGSLFGRDTYYGQKFFYKTAKGQMLTITVPKLATTVAEPYKPEHYPMLSNLLAVLDRIGTAVYGDAVIPVALAHSFAAIPLRTGSKVLTLLSKGLLGQTGP
jgi:hypothetical protein